jgi:GrpB-like predicted nucleotidyltransferase (UPF0157 family)
VSTVLAGKPTINGLKPVAASDGVRQSGIVSTNYTPIEVCSYKAEWQQQFQTRARAIRQSLGPVARRVDHVGSTAVPGLASKPTIDIQVAVTALEDLCGFKMPLERLGYTLHEKSLTDPEHRFFSVEARAAHVHVCPSGSEWERTHLLFRDYLRAHAEVARRYERLKYALAREHPQDRIAYADAKTEFVHETMQDAEQWAEQTSWAAPLSPAEAG